MYKPFFFTNFRIEVINHGKSFWVLASVINISATLEHHMYTVLPWPSVTTITHKNPNLQYMRLHNKLQDESLSLSPTSTQHIKSKINYWILLDFLFVVPCWISCCHTSHWGQLLSHVPSTEEKKINFDHGDQNPQNLCMETFRASIRFSIGQRKRGERVLFFPKEG